MFLSLRYMWASNWSINDNPSDLIRAIHWSRKALESDLILRGEDHEDVIDDRLDLADLEDKARRQILR